MRHSVLVGRLLVAALLGFGAPALAQSSGRPAPAPKAAAGTYQLVQLTKLEVAMTTDALVEIEKRRHETQEVSWQVSPIARVRILPRSVISKPGFKPLAPVYNAYYQK